jgi:hypothetical protein
MADGVLERQGIASKRRGFRFSSLDPPLELGDPCLRHDEVGA